MGRRSTSSLAAALAALAITVSGACGGSGGNHGPDVLSAGLADPGPFPVGMRTLDFTDESRPDTFSAGPRFLKTEVWYPAAESARDAPHASPLDWIPPQVRPFVPLIRFHGQRIFDFDTGAVRDAALASGRFPLIAFSHGNEGVRFQDFTLCDHLASRGYVVFSPDHIGNAGIAVRADGTLVPFSDEFGDPSLDRRIADMKFLISSFEALAAPGSGSFLSGAIDTSRGVGVSGHSFGGTTTVATAAADSRVTAAMPMAAATISGRMTPFTIPSVAWIAAEDRSIGLDGDAADQALFGISAPPRVFASLRNGGHVSFSDTCLFVPGLFGSDGCGEGTRYEDGTPFTFIAHDDAFALIGATATAFFGWQLGGDESLARLLLNNPSTAELAYQTVGF